MQILNVLMVQSLREGSAAQLCQNIGIGDYIVAIDGHTPTNTHNTHTHTLSTLFLKIDFDI
jgi:hypothetical protein